MCGEKEVEKNPTATGTDWPINFLTQAAINNGLKDYKQVAESLFIALNSLRSNVSDYVDNWIDLTYTQKIMSKWEESYDLFKWSEAMAMAARQVLNF